MSSNTLIYQPASHIIKRRQELAALFSPLRRVHPRIPFYKLPAHRIPTLWSLYRGLLKAAPSENIRWRMRLYFERYKSLTSHIQTRDKLLLGHKLLSMFKSAEAGHEKHRAILSRYESMIKAKRDKERLKLSLRTELAWQHRLLNRPILTGGYLRPTYTNPPLPRLKPQPERISMMCKRRIRARERRLVEHDALVEMRRDLREERLFEERLGDELRGGWGKGVGREEYTNGNGNGRDEGEGGVDRRFERVFGEESDWDNEIYKHRLLLASHLTTDTTRLLTPYPLPLLSQIHSARLTRAHNRAHEALRDARGELVPRYQRKRYPQLDGDGKGNGNGNGKARRGPPVHVWDGMSERRRRWDGVVRGSRSVVGYVGMVKSRLGMLKGGRGNSLGEGEGKDAKGEREGNESQLWEILEKGKRENRKMLNQEAEAIWDENRRRNVKQIEVID